MRQVLVCLLALLCLTACSAGEVTPRAHGVDVDTPQLRALKKAAGIAPCRPATASKAPQGLPDVSLPCLGGGPEVALARLRGPLVVNLWAQWCAPCRSELKYYQAFSRKYAGKVGVLGVDWQDTLPGRALELARRTGVTYPLVADTEPHIRGNVLPQLILIDSHGDIAFRQYVEITSLRQLEGLVRKHLGTAA